MNTNILDFGAKGDGVTLCTKEIQAAIDACAASGGGRVTVPAGLYVTGTLWLRDHVELHLEHAATLKASTNMDDYNELDAYEQNWSSPVNEKWLGKHLIIALECKNVALTGTGTLDGSGDAFFGEPSNQSVYAWTQGYRTVKDESILRPGQLICFIECQRVLVENVTLTNQPCWGCFFHGCEYVTVRGMQTRNPGSYFNSDGIDIDSCRYVTVSDCIIDTGDDAIAIRGSDFRLKNKPHPCEYITISNCVLGSYSHTIRVGVGNGLIRHVRISNLSIIRGAPAIGVMSSYHGMGKVSIEDVSFSNISATNTGRVISMIEGANAPIKNIVMENFSVETYGFFHSQSDFPTSVSDVTLRNWNVTMTDGPKHFSEYDMEKKGTEWFRAKNINRLKLENFAVTDSNNYLSAWPNGNFAFDGCDGYEMLNVTVNQKEY